MHESFIGVHTFFLTLGNPPKSHEEFLSAASFPTYLVNVLTPFPLDWVNALNSMFARLGTDYEIRNQCFFAILETMTTD